MFETLLQKKIKISTGLFLLALFIAAGLLLINAKSAQACFPSCFPECPCPPFCPPVCPTPPCEPEDIFGCTDPEAINYDLEATVDDGSCEYPPEEIEGCTDPEALNYDREATVDDGSCEYPAEPAPTTPGPEPKEPGPAGPPVCGAATPAAPHLISATAIGGNKVELKWGKVDGATHYSIYYGPSSGNYLYGVPNTGDTDNFIIEGMSSGCFVVRAVNDCAPSEASNEVCTGAVGGVAQVLGLSATSGNDASPVYFWGGILSLLFGTRILAQELQRKRV